MAGGSSKATGRATRGRKGGKRGARQSGSGDPANTKDSPSTPQPGPNQSLDPSSQSNTLPHRPANELVDDFNDVSMEPPLDGDDLDDEGITPATGSGKGRRRKSTKPAKQAHEHQQKTAQLPDEMMQHYLFTAIVDCAILNPHWGFGHKANRPLNLAHVNNLIQTFSTNGVHRFAPDHHMYASIPRDIGTKLVEMHETLKQSNRMSRAYNLEIIPNSVWDELHCRPTLDAGQHRRAAILTMNNVPLTAQNGICEMPTESSPDVKSTYWAVDFYNQTALGERPDIRLWLRGNPAWCRREGSSGDIFANFITLWSSWPKTKRDQYRSQSKLAELLTSLYICTKAETDVKRWLPLLQTREIFKECEEFTETQWGRHKFSLRIVSDSLSCRINFIFLQRWRQINVWFTRLFGTKRGEVTILDVQMIERLSVPPLTSQVDQLFFPQLEHIDTLKLKSALWPEGIRLEDLNDVPDDGDDAEPKAWPRLATPEERNGTFFYCRRPDFLTALTDDEYKDAANVLRGADIWEPENCLIKMEQFHLEMTKIGVQTRNLLIHVLVWLDETFELPHTSDKELRTFQFVTKLSEMLTRQRNHDPRKADKEAELFIISVYTSVKQHLAQWTHAEVAPWNTPPDKVSKWESAQLADYMERFHHPLWNWLLLQVHDLFEGHFPKGQMMALKGFNKKKAITNMRTPWTYWGAHVSQTQLQTNPEIRNLPSFSRVPEIREKLYEEACLFGARFMYWALSKLHSNVENNKISVDEDELAEILRQKTENANYLNDKAKQQLLNPLEVDDSVDWVLPSKGFARPLTREEETTLVTPRRPHLLPSMSSTKPWNTPSALKRQVNLTYTPTRPPFPGAKRRRREPASDHEGDVDMTEITGDARDTPDDEEEEAVESGAEDHGSGGMDEDVDETLE